MNHKKRSYSLFLLLMFISAFILMLLISFTNWAPAEKWWILGTAYLAGSGFLLLNKHLKNSFAILIFTIVLLFFTTVSGFHQAFPFRTLKDNSLQTLVEAYPAPQTDTYILYSYLARHFQDPIVIVSTALERPLSEEALFALGGAAQVNFVDDVEQSGCALNKENIALIEGFFSIDYAFGKDIQQINPTICIWQDNNNLYVTSK